MTRLLAVIASSIALGAVAVVPAAAARAVTPLLAPPSACPHQNQVATPNTEQAQAMRCLTNFARANSGLDRLNASQPLAQAAAAKNRDMIRCDDFSHEACGREFTYWMVHVGYLTGSCWGAAENIAWGTGPIGTPRAIFRAWLRSPGHRENILGPYADLGIALREGTIEAHAGAHVWVQEFGTHTC
jgi:uncharacterized protein YkwD